MHTPANIIRNKNIFETYLERQKGFVPGISSPPDQKLKLCVVIPCYNENNIAPTLNSLYCCIEPDFSTEIIVVINSPENAPDEVLLQNQQTINELIHFKNKVSRLNISLHYLQFTHVPKKVAGAGYARKKGMDEAIHRFMLTKQYDGIILSLDADTTVDAHYLIHIEKFYSIYPLATGCNLNFKHRIEEISNEKQVHSILQYELYIRYFREALEMTGFPNPYYTIGSAFTLNARAYCKQGGMNTKQAGEDFYFLQKIFYLDHFYELNSVCVYPSARISERAVFGTGPTLKTLMTSDTNYEVYAFESFQLLHLLFNAFLQFYTDEYSLDAMEKNDVMLPVLHFLQLFHYREKLIEIKRNVADRPMYEKRLYHTFNNFFVVKCLNHLSRTLFPKEDIRICASKLLNHLHVQHEPSVKEMVETYSNLYQQKGINLPQ